MNVNDWLDELAAFDACGYKLQSVDDSDDSVDAALDEWEWRL